jgi:hypothetical protein
VYVIAVTDIAADFKLDQDFTMFMNLTDAASGRKLSREYLSPKRTRPPQDWASSSFLGERVLPAPVDSLPDE